MIKNKTQLIKNGKTAKEKKVRRDLLKILEKVVESVNPEKIIKDNVVLRNGKLFIKSPSFSPFKKGGSKGGFDLKNYKNIYVVGAGKATYFMARALEGILGKQIKEGLINVTKIFGRKLSHIKINLASHPIPNKSGVLGAQKIVKILKKAQKDDLIIALISGGGSALLPLPAPGISLSDIIKISDLLIRSRAPIDEINVIRKHVSQIKGGQLARLSYPATLVSLYISDVVGDDLSVIASGLTSPDLSTYVQAISILKKYKLWGKTPQSIKKHLQKGARGGITETPKPNDVVFRNGKIHNFILASGKIALEKATLVAKKLSYHVFPLTSFLEGEVHEVSKVFLSFAYEIQKYNSRIKPALILASGETTLNLTGRGQGGRNQELVMASIPKLKEGITLVSFGTDGVDGRTKVPVAGGVASFSTKKKSEKLNLDINKFLAENSSYDYLKKLGELIKTGYTGTNVGDLVLVAIV
jgi:glycerate-2-kinase